MKRVMQWIQDKVFSYGFRGIFPCLVAMAMMGCGDLNEDAAPYISGGAPWKSLNWAGEIIAPSPVVAGACRTFVVPNYSTGSAIGHKVDHFVGVGGGSANCNLIQGGVLAERTFAGINRNFFWQFWPGTFHQSGMSVASGQQVSMCAERLPNGHGKVTLWNDTLGIAEVHDEAPVGTNCSNTAEWPTERVPNGSGGLAPVLAFSQFQDWNIWAWDANGNNIPVNAAQSGGVDPDIYASVAVGSAKLVDVSFIESNATQVTTWNQAQ